MGIISRLFFLTLAIELPQYSGLLIRFNKRFHSKCRRSSAWARFDGKRTDVDPGVGSASDAAGLPDGFETEMVPRSGNNRTRILMEAGSSNLRVVEKYLGVSMKSRVLWLGVLLSLSLAAWGQDSASITGTVTDQSGAAVPNAQVTVSSPDRGINRPTTTNAAATTWWPACPRVRST